MKIITQLTDLTPDPHNANDGTERGATFLDYSVETYGAGRGVVVDRDGVVRAGNKTVETAVARGLAVRVVQTEGDTLVVGQRLDLHLATQPAARQLAYADNQASDFGLHWNPAQLAADAAAVSFPLVLFTPEELDHVTRPPAPEIRVAFATAADLARWRAFMRQFATPEAFDAWIAAQLTEEMP